MNRTLKEATVQRYYYETHDQLRQHLADFVSAYNFGRRLKTLKGLTPLRVHLQNLDERASALQNQSSPPNARTKYLGFASAPPVDLVALPCEADPRSYRFVLFC
jgi:hypothetical protein